MKISRRMLIGGGVAVTGAATFGGYRVLVPMTDHQGTVASFIARHVPAVAADDAAVTTFASEVMGMVNRRYRSNMDVHMVLMANPVLKRFLGEDQSIIQDDLERNLLTTFLRSTDLLLPTRQEGPVRFIVIADPYVAGCSNPLAQLG